MRFKIPFLEKFHVEITFAFEVASVTLSDSVEAHRFVQEPTKVVETSFCIPRMPPPFMRILAHWYMMTCHPRYLKFLNSNEYSK